MTLKQIDEMNKLYRNVGGGADWSVDAWALGRSIVALDDETTDSTIEIVYRPDEEQSEAAYDALGSSADWITVATVYSVDIVITLNLHALEYDGRTRLIERNTKCC